MAFRNAVGMLLSLALGTATQIAFGAPAAACGALFVSYSDGSDPYRHRATRMIAASITLAFAAFVGAMSEQYRFGVGVVAAAAAFVAGMAVALGQTAANIGMVSLVMLTIFAGQRLTLKNSVEAALLPLLGDSSKQHSLWPSGLFADTIPNGARWHCCTWNSDALPWSRLNWAPHRRRPHTCRKRRKLSGARDRIVTTRACGTSRS
jgi:hypothetical protein